MKKLSMLAMAALFAMAMNSSAWWWSKKAAPEKEAAPAVAEKADAALIQWDATAATLKALGCTTIDRVLLA